MKDRQLIPLSLRVAWSNGGNGDNTVSIVKDIYYDMTDDKGCFVKISKDWQLVYIVSLFIPDIPHGTLILHA